jgi:hypothetical protein
MMVLKYCLLELELKKWVPTDELGANPLALRMIQRPVIDQLSTKLVYTSLRRRVCAEFVQCLEKAASSKENGRHLQDS